MKTKRGFRKGLGFGQIAATLLVVLPTLAFIVTLLLDYWGVMQADYRLKLLSNYTAEYLIDKDDLRDYSGSDFTEYLAKANSMCPGGTQVTFPRIEDAPKGQIEVVVKYVYNGTYLKDKTIVTKMYTYSYKDQNISVDVVCE